MGDTLTGPVIGILVAQVQSRQKILGLAYQEIPVMFQSQRIKTKNCTKCLQMIL